MYSARASGQTRRAPLIVAPGRGRFDWISLEIACRVSIVAPAECGRRAHCNASSNDRQERSMQEPVHKTTRTTQDHAQSTLNEKDCALRGVDPQGRESTGRSSVASRPLAGRRHHRHGPPSLPSPATGSPRAARSPHVHLCPALSHILSLPALNRRKACDPRGPALRPPCATATSQASETSH